MVPAAIATTALVWICRHDPSINFLPEDGRAAWILFPRPVHPASHKIVTLDTLFRREFSLTSRPEKAELKIRAAKQVDLRINDMSVTLPPVHHWKDEAAMDVASFLRTGTNTIEVRVFNDNAPAALWLVAGDGFLLRTDQSWDASLAGSAWKPVAMASTPRLPGPGNPLAGGETTLGGLRASWPFELLLAFTAVTLCAVAFHWRIRWQEWADRNSTVQVAALIGLAATIWIVLFANNAFRLPFLAGFDAGDHIKYISYIQERRALPSPTKGYEMFQAPLFYVVSAILLGACRLSAVDGAGIILLRFLTTLFGIAQFTFVFLSVRLLFPRRLILQIVGLLLAAFLPMQLYLSHYVTNETLAAVLSSASLYFCLRLIRNGNAPVSYYAFFGLTVGAALLAKATTFLLVPPLFLTLGASLWSQRIPTGRWLRSFGSAALATFAVSGWYYLPIWKRFGTPFLGNWDLASGFSWWQDPGYHVAADYGRFGHSLVDPLFSSLNSFADGIYSTLWGDALCGGVSDMAFRPPWNYGLMVCGYLLALVPTLLILVGAAFALRRVVRKPSFEYFILLTVAAAVVFGVLFMTLKVACFGQIKAFYGLSAIVPLCIFGVIGWEVAARHRPRLQFLMGSLLLFWAMNSFASVWIYRSPEQRLFMARRLRSDHQTAVALVEARKVMTADPRNADAVRLSASILEERGEADEALTMARRAVEISPLNPASHWQVSMILANQGQAAAALNEARRTVELGPQEPLAHDLLLSCLVQSKQNDEIVRAARDALTVSPFNAFLHDTLGIAAAQQGDFFNAMAQFAYATLISPKWPEPQGKFKLVLSALPGDADASRHLVQVGSIARDSSALLNELAWLEATSPDANLRSGSKAVRLAERACDLTSRRNTMLMATLAASYAEAGRFTEAIRTAEVALELARSAGDATVARRAENLLTEFRANRPYRDQFPSH